jgi:K+-sensing histidine kinase KdpD
MHRPVWVEDYLARKRGPNNNRARTGNGDLQIDATALFSCELDMIRALVITSAAAMALMSAGLVCVCGVIMAFMIAVVVMLVIMVFELAFIALMITVIMTLVFVVMRSTRRFPRSAIIASMCSVVMTIVLALGGSIASQSDDRNDNYGDK